MSDGMDVRNTIIDEIARLKYITSRERYFERLEFVKRLWLQHEPELPLYTEEEIKKIIRERVGKVNFQRCVMVSRVLARNMRPARFMEIMEEVRPSPEFDVQTSSLNKILARVFNYLISAGLVTKCCRITRAGREADVYYFRLYRLVNRREETCRNCKILMKIAEVLKNSGLLVDSV